MDSYLVPAGYGEVELTEKRSRFIGQVWRVETEAEARVQFLFEPVRRGSEHENVLCHMRI